MAKKFVKRTDANNEILYFYTHSDVVDVGEGNATTSLTNALNNKANTSDVQALSDDALRKSPQSLSSQEKSQVHNNIGTESFVDDRAVRYDDAQVLGTEEKTQALTNLGLNGVDEEPTPNSDNLVKSGGVLNAIDSILNDVSYTVANRALLADGTFGTNTSYKHAAIQVNAGEKYIVTNMQDLSAQNPFTRYAFATSGSVPDADPVDGKRHVPFVEGYESVAVVPVGGWDVVVIPEGCTYLLVNYGETYPLHVKNYQFIDNKPIYKGEKLVRNGVMMDSIIQSNYGYVVLEGYGMNRGGSGENARVNFGKYSNLTCVVIRVPDNAVKMYINGEIPSVKPYSGIFFDDFEMPLNVIYSGQDYPLTHFRAGVVPEGTKLAIFNVKEDDYVDGVLKPFDISYDYADLDVNGLLGFQGKKVSIIGASIETFGAYSYGYDRGGNIEQSNRYYRTCSNNVRNVLLTWWMQLIKKGGGVLERNNSIGSSGVSRNEAHGKTCFLDRYNDLGNPDIILVHGGANEPSDITYKDFDPTIPIEELDEYDFTQSYDKLIRLLMLTYPNARIIIVYSGQNQNKDKAISSIAAYYQLECIEYVNTLGDRLTFIPDDTVHPDSNGMKAMSTLIISRLENSFMGLVTEQELNQEIEEVNDAITFKEAGTCEDDDVLVYVADKDGKVFATINKDGSITKKVLNEREKADRQFLQMVSSDIDGEEDVLKYLSDEENKCFGYIKKDGTVVLYKAEIKNLKSEGGDDKHSASEAQMAAILGLVATGVDNIDMSNNPKVMAVLKNLFTENVVNINADNQNDKNLRPIISIIDDDTIDYMITSPTAEGKRGGFFSVLLPMMLSLGEKHGIKIPVGLACEGHRVGLTHYMSADDSYTELNKTGNAIKWLHNNMNWNVFNHSMTAQLPQHTYYVDGINSTLANTILSRGQWLSDYNFWNTIVLDRLTGKWYECRKQKGTKVWAERTPTKKYAMPFYREYINPADPNANHDGPWHFNRDFDFDYSWGEWFKRADELGLPYEKVIVHNGGTSHVYTAAAGRKYAYFSVRTSGIYNYPPIPATVNRADGDPSGFATSGVNDYNVYNEDWVNKRKVQIDDCIANNYWMILMTHFNDSYFSNYYRDDKDYPAKDEAYPEEWILPLKVVYNGGVVVEDEIQSIMDGTHDYIHTPPARLGINTWSQWHPAPGTHLAGLYELLDYALTQGVDFVSPWDGWKIFGNILNIGVDKMNQSYSFNAEDQTPYTDEEKSYLTIGADMSIRYYNSKKKN